MSLRPAAVSATLFAMACLAPSIAAEPGGTPSATVGATSPEVQRLLDAAMALKDGPVAAARYHYEMGVKAQQANRLPEALESYRSALRLDPSNLDYRRALRNAEALNGQARDSLGIATEHLTDDQLSQEQQRRVEIENLIAKAERAIVQGEYPEADRFLQMARVRTETLPTWSQSKPQTLRQIERLSADNQVRREESERTAAVQRTRTAVNQGEAMRIEALRIERMRIDEMLSRAERARERREYDEAIILCEQVLKINRAEPRADVLIARLRRERHLWLRQVLGDQWEESHRRISEQIRKDLLPQHELIRYSTDWPEIDARRRAPTYELNDRTETWRAAIDAQLEQEITLQFPEGEFMEVIRYLQRISAVNFVVEPAIAARNTPVNIQIDRMRLRNALNLLMNVTGLKYAVRDEVVYIGSDAQSAGSNLMRFYDIRDLTHQLRSFPGPTLELPDTNTPGGVSLLPEIAPPAAQQSTSFIDLVKKVIAPTTWNAPNTIEDVQGQLMVNHSPEVHKQIEDLLRMLRSHQGTQIHVKVRFLEVENSLIEEIGVNWQNFNPLIGNGFGGVIPPAGMPYPLPGTNPPANPFAVPPIIGPTGTPGMYYRPTQNDTIAGSLLSSSLLPYTDSAGLSRPDAGEGLSLSTQYWQLSDSLFARAVLHAVEKERRGNVLYAPELTLFSGQQAHLVQLNQQAYIAGYDANGQAYSPIIRTLVYGTVIDVHAVASADKRYITLTMRPTNAQVAAWRNFGSPPTNNQGASLGLSSGPGISENLAVGVSYPLQIPTLDLQRVMTTVVLPDGGSMILAARTNSSSQRASSGVPFLSHIPFLGRLFSTHGRSETELRTLIVVTANLILYPEIEGSL